jgi:hypothetical protein
MKLHRFGMLLFVLAIVFVLVACSSTKAKTTPTPTQESLEAISTQAALTAFVQLTQLALTMPPTVANTNTPVMTPTATPALPTQTLRPPVVVSCANSKFGTDVTIPDGTPMTVGQVFTKTWRVTNSGSCTWTTSFKLAFSNGDVMGGQTAFLANPVPVGQPVDLSVKLTVPNKSGTLTGWWVILDDAGHRVGDALSVVINVGVLSPTPSGTLTISPTRTLTPPSGSSTPTPTDTNTSVPSDTPIPSETPTETPTPTGT